MSYNFNENKMQTTRIKFLIVLFIVVILFAYYNLENRPNTKNDKITETYDHDDHNHDHYHNHNEQIKDDELVVEQSKDEALNDQQLETTQTSDKTSGRIKACIIMLCRDSDLEKVQFVIRNFDEKFNSKYKYDYVILNDKQFSDQFKTNIRSLTTSTVKIEQVPLEQWSYPPNKNKSNDRQSYNFMCRFFSGFFYDHPALIEYDYYWRVEPDSEYYCNIDYDPFKYLIDNNKQYGFTITLLEALWTVPTLWSVTKKFMTENPELLNKANNLKFITDSSDNYNLCQIYNNFEIAAFSIFRSARYRKYFEYLEKDGGFFRERWGDAPVHTIAVSMFLSRNDIHYFEDIGYRHLHVKYCPTNSSKQQNCQCSFEQSYQFAYESGCYNKWKNL